MKLKERWKPVVGFEGFYEVSDQGRVRSLQARFRWPAGRIMDQPINWCGYLSATISRGGVSKRRPVHTLVAEAFIGPRPTGFQLNHKNGVKTDNRLENLEWVSPRENIRHSYRIGLSRPRMGERSNFSKLRNKDVVAIRTLAGRGVERKILASRFKLSLRGVGQIINRESWAHL